MPRYYFDVTDGDRFISDKEGLDLPNSGRAREEAMIALPLIASEEKPPLDLHEVVVHVRDEFGQILYRATLSMTSKPAH